MYRIALVLVLIGCSADDVKDVVQASPCSQLRDHLVELRVGIASGTPEQLAQHREAMQRALGTDFVASCAKTLTAAQIACSLEAPDLASATGCSGPAARD